LQYDVRRILREICEANHERWRLTCGTANL
jgi:hypothetical protein